MKSVKTSKVDGAAPSLYSAVGLKTAFEAQQYFSNLQSEIAKAMSTSRGNTKRGKYKVSGDPKNPSSLTFSVASEAK